MSISSTVTWRLGAFLIVWTIMALNAPNVAADATCFCKVSSSNLSGVCHPNASQILFDLTGAVNKKYPSRTETRWQECKQRCSDEALAAKDAVAAAACKAGVANGTTFHAYAALGSCGKRGEYASAQALGALINTPAVTQTSCTCPQGWTPNAPSGIAGVTTDGRCKKLACQPNHITPFPPNGTPIGTPVPAYGTTATSWGFTWGDAFIAWGTTANGGAPTSCTTEIVSPAVCKF